MGFILKAFDYPSHWFYHIYRPFDYILIAAFFYHELRGTSKKKFIKLTCFLFILICILYSGVNNFSGPTSLTSTIGNMFTITLCIIYLQDVLSSNENEEIRLIKEPVFWIATGTLFYCLATFFSMGFLKYLRQKNSSLAEKYFVINYIMNYALYLTYIIGMLCSKKFQRLN